MFGAPVDKHNIFTIYKNSEFNGAKMGLDEENKVVSQVKSLFGEVSILAYNLSLLE